MRNLVAALLSMALASPAAAGFLYTVEEIGDRLIRIDTDTLTLTDVGPLGTIFAFGGLAHDRSTDTMYLIGGRSNDNLFTVNRATGAATLVGPHSVSDLFGLAFDSQNGVLYGSTFSGAPTALYSLDTGNGAATLIGPMSPFLGGLAYDSTRDQLVGVNDGTGLLYDVDRANGTLTLLGGGPFTNNSGLAYDSENDLFWDIDFNGDLASYDPNNGYLKTVHLTGLGPHDGLAFVGSTIIEAHTPACGDFSTCSDAAFLTAVGGGPLDVFEDFTTQSGMDVDSDGFGELDGSSILSGVTFSSLVSGTYGGTDSSLVNFGAGIGAEIGPDSNFDGILRIDFDPAVSAVGFGTVEVSSPERIRLYDGATLLLDRGGISDDVFDYAGFVAIGSAKITRVEIEGDFFAIQNIQFNLRGAICGDGIFDLGEECDDGNTVDGDGCSSVCTSEPALFEADQANAQLGFSVASAGDVNGDGFADVIVGAALYDAGETDEGAAFVFLGSATGIADGNPASAATQIESNQANARLGFSVAGAGDVDSDGFADVIVGADGYDAGQADEGAAFVFLGSAAGIADGDPGTAHAQLESDQTGAFLGRSVAGAGDVNDDGYADVIVGARNYDAGQTDEGAAFVFLGSAAGIADGDPGTAHAQLEGNQTWARLGGSVAGAGDVDSDGFADVIVGARTYDAGETDEGAAFVFLGSAAGIADGDPSTAHAQLESNQASAYLGRSVAGAGDVNDDGFADVIVGADGYDAGEANEGAAFVFLGSAVGIADGDPATAATQLESNQANANLGYSVDGAGDFDDDGIDDVIVGARFYDAGETDEGAAFVFLGGAAGVADGDPGSAYAQLESDQANARFGTSVAGAGDVDGDGAGELIVGAPLYDAGEVNEGAAFVFLGSIPPPPLELTGQQVDLTYNFGNSSGSLSAIVGSGSEFMLEGLPSQPPEFSALATIDFSASGLTLTHNRFTTLGPSLPDVTDDFLTFTFPNLPNGAIIDVVLTADPLPNWFSGLAFTDNSITLTQLVNPVHVEAQLKTWTIELDGSGSPRPVPEPGAMVSLLSGVGLLTWLNRRRSRTTLR